MARFPECWQSCGACANGNPFVLEVLVAPGDLIRADDTILVLETGKVALDIPSPYGGTVGEVFVTAGDPASEKMPLISVLTGAA